MMEMEDNSIDAIVTDPPYGLSNDPPMSDVLEAWMNDKIYKPQQKGGFMGCTWDAFIPGPEIWREALRVLKPGGHILCFGGSRTVDLMGLALRLAGFEIRDQLQWIYSTGWPKSKANLKPGHEPIILARKPLQGTLQANLQKFGTGTLQIDACRVPGKIESGWNKYGSKASENTALAGRNYHRDPKPDPINGRWPSNIILDKEAAAFLDSQNPKTKSSLYPEHIAKGDVLPLTKRSAGGYQDEGGVSRFFYSPKASKKERSQGLTDPNPHNTIKPIELMSYLLQLVTPPNGVVFDPFAGSGSTGCAAAVLGIEFVGAELDTVFARVANDRILHWAA